MAEGPDVSKPLHLALASVAAPGRLAGSDRPSDGVERYPDHRVHRIDHDVSMGVIARHVGVVFGKWVAVDGQDRSGRNAME